MRGPHWFFRGLIDDVRISRVARYDKDFVPAERFENDENTLALYHFDSGQGDKLIDSSGNGHLEIVKFFERKFAALKLVLTNHD